MSCIVDSNSELSSLTIYALFAIIFFCYSWQTFRPKDLIIVNTTRKSMWTNCNKINKDQYSVRCVNFFRIIILYQTEISSEKCQSCLPQVINIFNFFNTDSISASKQMVFDRKWRILEPSYHSYALLSLPLNLPMFLSGERKRQIIDIS